MSVRRKKRKVTLFSVLLLLILACAAAALALLRPKPDPAMSLNTMLEEVRAQKAAALNGADSALTEAWKRCFSLQTEGPFSQSLRTAAGSVKATFLDEALLTDGLADEMQAIFEARAAQAKRREELYTVDGAILPALVGELYDSALHSRLARAEEYCQSEIVPVTLRFTKGEWALEDQTALLAIPALSPRPGFDECAAALQPVALHYSLSPTQASPLPDPACYGESSDPGEIMRLLETETAKRLINGQKLDFDPARDMLGRSIYYYLDETILVLVWQQDEHGALGTFAEVFIADASQLRRKLADDTFGSYQYYYPSEFAAQTNAVLACSGDFYNSGRADYGLYVYQGELMRYNLMGGQSCLFTDEGDMLFTYENQFSSVEEAEQFIRDNNVTFSLSFGPVILDKGEDVTPYDYPFGEVLDTYARCAVGQLGKRHYLMMTINCESPDHYVYVTLRQAADSMIAHGCYNAYTLDGGQTGSILIGGRLINPVQFGVERQMSDIFYFATALPNDES